MDALIAGKYRVARKLGSGGMADVFLAQAEGAVGFARSVVIKRLDPALARDPEATAMFLDEARIASRLHHDHIAQVFDFGSDRDGYFIVMEYLAGVDAKHLVRGARGDVPLAAAVTIVARAAAGLHHAHEQRDDRGEPLGIVHRDVTAGNVFVTTEGGVKVIDFGIARAAVRTAVTRTGLVKGTVAYMSPEQVGGLIVDRRSDVFSLGVVLYELVTGRRPFDQPGDPELVVMRRIQAGIFTPPSALRRDLPNDLEELVDRMLAVDPGSRPATAEAVAIELDAIARRNGWSTSPIDLARYVRGLGAGSQPPAAPPEPPTVADLPSNKPDAAIVEVDLAPPRQTEAIAREPNKSPRRRWIAVAAAAPIAIIVAIAAAMSREPKPDPKPIDAPIVVAPADAATTPPAIDPSAKDPWPSRVDVSALDAGSQPIDVAPSDRTAAECVHLAEGMISAIDTVYPTIRRGREAAETARAFLGDDPSEFYRNIGRGCRNVRGAARYREVSDELARVRDKLADREREKHLVFTSMSPLGTAIYADGDTGKIVGERDVDGR